MDDSNLHTDTHHYMQQICFNAAASVHIKENSTSRLYSFKDVQIFERWSY